MLPWLSLILCYAGFTGLALAMPRHHEELCGRKPGPRSRPFWRLAGWLGLGLSLIPALMSWANIPIALSAWLGLATVAAFALAMVMTYAAPGRRALLLSLPVVLALVCAVAFTAWP